MKTIKIIDLLNMISKGEEVPEKIKKTWVYEWNYDYIREKFTYMQEDGTRFDEDWLIENILNEEIEIIEPQEHKIPEKLNIINGAVDGKWENGKSYNYTLSAPQTVIIHKINEIIDYLEKIE